MRALYCLSQMQRLSSTSVRMQGNLLALVHDPDSGLASRSGTRFRPAAAAAYRVVVARVQLRIEAACMPLVDVEAVETLGGVAAAVAHTLLVVVGMEWPYWCLDDIWVAAVARC